MQSISRGQRAYLAAVAVLGLWVGVFCYFNPSLADWGIPWLLPTLCATFLGSMYLSGGIGLVACLLSRRWNEIRSVIPIIVIWTGGLTIVSLFYLGAFNFAKAQVWMWFIAYIAYPLIGIAYLWRKRGQAHDRPRGEAALPSSVKIYLAVQGISMVLLSTALFVAEPLMQALWPWKTGVMMLQLYSQPFLAYGIGSLILSRRHAWAEIRNGVFAMGIFTGAEVLASLRFLPLFDGPQLAVAVWLGSLGVSAFVLLSLAARSVTVGKNIVLSTPFSLWEKGRG